MKTIKTLIFLACMAPMAASATDKTVWFDVGNLTGCTAAAIDSAVDCEVRERGLSGVAGYNVLTLEIFYDYAAGTGITFQIETCNEGMSDADCTDATDWFLLQSEAISSGTATLSEYTVTKVVGADYRFVWSLAINYRRLRVANLVATGSPTSSDKINVYARLGVIPAM